ncbi:MAG: SusC/RagA family TonB-linked outer membrane protein [Tannerellaceae bacterium]|nr:SusC/RagA family TonB-linked outer membrane protein [Tannerellaceae bacterium]
MAKRKVLLTGKRFLYLFLIFLFFPSLIYSQNRVNGRVVDKRTEEPIIGASIAFPGTHTGTITDIDGYFTFPVSEELPVVLHISYMGYRTEEINIYDLNESLLVELTENLYYLEGVVVVGYGTQKRKDITGSVASLKDKDLNLEIATSVDQLLQGVSAGVQVQQSSSEPGGGISVRIRGGSFINAGNEPLYVIDGLPINNSSTLSASSGQGGLAENQTPRNPLNSLNTNDIESIEILKDASATAIYGSRGANGVIIITTKRGRKDGTTVNYSFNAGVQQVAKKIDVLSTEQYIRTMNELSVERGGTAVFTTEDINRIGKGTDWQDEIFRNAFVQSHNLSLSGGNEKTSYYTSFNYLSQDGVVKKYWYR